jgi:GNAT superfamily N-acetyltransferase
MTTLRQSITDWAKRWSTRTQAEFRAIRRYPRDVRFRIFQTADESACLEIYQSLKAGFPPNGTDNFLASLRHRDSAIVVAEREGVIIGMGGISMSGENTATLWYGLVSPAYQGSGIGTALTLFRLCTLPSDEFGVMIYTLRKSQGFYAKLGFQSWFEWNDGDGHKHPAALLDLAGFRRDFVLDALRDRGVVLDGTLVPRPPDEVRFDRILHPDGRHHFTYRQAVPLEG